jgi:hypothetical protein
MTSMPWDARGEAQAALRTIVTDPQFGPATLSNPQTMTNLLKDMLPDSPRESSVLVAASDAGVPDMLQSSVSKGMDVGTASRLAVGSFENRTALTPDACQWAVGAMVSALRLEARGQQTISTGPVPGPAPVPGPGLGPAPVPGPGPGPAPVPGPPPGPEAGRASGPRIVAVAAAAIGAVLIVWACALTFVHYPASNGSPAVSYSFFSVAGDPFGSWWYAIGPVTVAVLAIAAAIVLIVAHAEWLRMLAAGMLLAFGLVTALVFATYAFTQGSSAHPGAAETVGALGALLLLAAGVFAVVDRKTSAGAAS